MKDIPLKKGEEIKYLSLHYFKILNKVYMFSSFKYPKMGLFFRKKKAETLLPPSEDLLSFPKSLPREREIRPEKIKEIAGLELPPLPQRRGKGEAEIKRAKEGARLREEAEEQFPVSPIIKKPHFLRIQEYQKLRENLGEIREWGEKLEALCGSLEKSEFNENKDYESLKNDLKKIHERLLFMDELIFKK